METFAASVTILSFGNHQRKLADSEEAGQAQTHLWQHFFAKHSFGGLKMFIYWHLIILV